MLADTSPRNYGCAAILAGFAVLAACGNPPEDAVPSGSALPEGVYAAPLDVEADELASGFTIPWAIAVIGEDEYLVSERLGDLFHYRRGEAVALDGIPETLTVTIDGLTFGGLMDVSLHPDFETNGLVYVSYVNESGRMAVARFNFGDRSVRDFETIFESRAFSIGSRIAWDGNGHFFVTQGMGGAPRPDPGPQDLDVDGGKIHRLMADGAVPADNPVFEGRSGASSVWSYGHRDPQGLYFDADEGRLYATEHGPLGGDELNVIAGGGNYGWPLFSYGLNYDGTPVSGMTEAEAGQTTVLPLKHWDWNFNMAPSGLERPKGSLFTDWNGAFVFGSLAQRRLMAYDVDSDRTAILLDDVGRVRDVAQLPSGSLLIAIDALGPGGPGSGRIVKLTPR